MENNIQPKNVQIPDKLFFTIREVSDISGVKSYILRYWEKQFKFLKPVRSIGGQRAYRKKDIEMVLLIQRLLYNEGFTIEGAKKKLKDIKKTEVQIEINFKELELADTIDKIKKKLSDLKMTIG
jgi:DNA-binding transcriptional MerR regulator